MLTIIERNGCCGFVAKEARILQHYLEDIYDYHLDVDYILYEFTYENETRYSFYVKTGNRFTRMFTKSQELQPCPSVNLTDGTITGKYGNKKCPEKVIGKVTYEADNYHPFYINYFMEVYEEGSLCSDR